MKISNAIISIFIFMFIIMALEIRSAVKETHRYRDKYYYAQERAIENLIEANTNMKNHSLCLADQATETGLRWKCEETLYDLRKWLQDKQ